MKNENDVTLVVAGKDYGGWTGINISSGIERSASSFQLGVTRKWPGSKNFQRQVNPFDSCEVYIGQDKVLTGDIDAVPISYNEKTFTMQINGRSKTARLVDCSVINEPGQWNRQAVEQIASAIAAPYGIKIIVSGNTGKPIADHQVQQGETCFESIDRMIKLRQLLAFDDADGNLIIAEAGSKTNGGILKLGGDDGNILECQAEHDFKDVFSEYICKGQHSGDDLEDEDEQDDAIPSYSQNVGIATDGKIPYRRTLVIKQSGQANEQTCGDRARFERNYRRARADMRTYTVKGWRQADGKLWIPNVLVYVQDAVNGENKNLLISEVERTLENGTFKTKLIVGPRDGFIKPADDEEKKKSGDQWEGVEAAEDDDGE